MIRDTSAQDHKLTPSVARRVVRWGWLVVAAALALGVFFAAKKWLPGDRSVDADRVRIATVRRGTLVRDIAGDARVTAANSPTLSAPAAGTIAVKVAAGDRVALGHPVAIITSPELLSRLAQERTTRDQLEADLGRFRLRVEQSRAKAQSLVDQAKVDRQTALRELDQHSEGFRDGVVPESTMLRSKDALAKADIALAHSRENATLEAKALEFERTSTALQLERQREVVRELERRVESLTVRSPVDGMVGKLEVRDRAAVDESQPILSVVDLSALELEIQVPESFARELGPGMPAEIDVRGRVVAGQIRSVSPEVISGEVAARIQFVGDLPEGLRQNQRLGARIIIDQKDDVLLIDRGPSLDSGANAYAVRDGLAVRRPIRVGAVGVREVEILEGASVGDRIVVAGADAFNNEERVRLSGE